MTRLDSVQDGCWVNLTYPSEDELNTVAVTLGVEPSFLRAALDEVIGILEKAPCPAVLAEQCFLSNSGDYEAWATPQGCQRAARVYYEAICRYFGTQPIAQA